MKAITTKYIPMTNTRGPKIKATAEGVKPMTIPDIYAAGSDYGHKLAALALCKRMNWGENLIGGGLPDTSGNVYVFADDLVNAIEACLPDLKHYAATHGTGPDERLKELMAVLAEVRS